MKKIVALVLTLVLALSLATVAFAANNAYLAYVGADEKEHVYSFGGIELKDNKYFTLSLETVKEANEDYHTVDQYKVFLSITGTDVSLPLPGVYVESTSDDFDFIFYSKNDTHYLNLYLLGAYSGEATAIETVTWADYNYKTTPCDTYVSDYALYDYDGNVMMATEFSLANLRSIKAIALVDGNLVALTPATAIEGSAEGDYYVVPHTYIADWEFVGGTLKVKTVGCKYCKATFDFVVGSKADATKAFGAGNFEAIETADNELNDKLGTKSIWISTATAGTDAADGNKDVKSATTFDAGVALYAGMALMSVAGSAVVIGKKKEF